MKLAAVSTKGGTGKTTSCVYLATALHRRGRTLALDTDKQGSLLSWSAGLPFNVVSVPTRDVHRRAGDLSADYEHLVMDSPPGDEGIIRSVILAVDIVIVPVSATGLDLDRLAPTWDLLAELESIHPVAVGVLLTKIRAGTRSSREARAVLTDMKYPVLDTEIPLAEAYAGTFGATPVTLGRYDDLLTELQGAS